MNRTTLVFVVAVFAVSFIVLFASLYVIIFTPENGRACEWAYGSVGLILGYWLGTPSKMPRKGSISV